MQDRKGASPEALALCLMHCLAGNPDPAVLGKMGTKGASSCTGHKGGRHFLQAPPSPGILGTKVRKSLSPNKPFVKTIFLGAMTWVRSRRESLGYLKLIRAHGNRGRWA